MAINLQKGQKIEVGLNNISVGLGWNPNESTGQDFDLDASAFMINAARQIPNEGYFIYYGNPNSPDGAVKHSGDARTGAESLGDDETMSINLKSLNPDINEILFIVTIHEALARKQNFGQVRQSFIRIVDNSNGAEIAKYELDEDFSVETAVEFGRLYKRNDEWKFEASGLGYKEDLSFFVSKYYSGDVVS